MCQLGDGAGDPDSKTEITGGDTIVGQIASFMENLRLSYREVYEDLPYLLLLALSADKPKVVYGGKDDTRVVKMSGKDLMKKKIG